MFISPIRVAIIEILILIMGLSKNAIKLLQTKKQIDSQREKDKEKNISQRLLKFRYLFFLFVAAFLRSLTLLCLLGEPDGLYFYLLYSIPNIFWLVSYLKLMGFLGELYLQIKKMNFEKLKYFVRTCSIVIGILLPLFFIKSSPHLFLLFY